MFGIMQTELVKEDIVSTEVYRSATNDIDKWEYTFSELTIALL
jgi:hypothetical protein